MAGKYKLPYIWPGTRFGRLTVIAECEPSANRGGRHYFCQCECGEATSAAGEFLLKGNKSSCGCLAIDLLVSRSLKHGHVKNGKNGSRTYTSWVQMRQRCLNSNHTFYSEYGGRGITVCERWLHSFENFLADMGERPEETSLDRIDVTKGYSPENCRWLSQKGQCRNKRDNLLLTYDGKSLCASEWAEITGITASTIRKRHRAGWDVQRTLTEPMRKITQRKSHASN